MKKITCPHCGWEINVPGNGVIDASFGPAVRKGEKMKALFKKIKTMRADPQLDEANAWIDITCTKCEHSYQYNVRTGKTRP